jgi:hypothetical protein
MISAQREKVKKPYERGGCAPSRRDYSLFYNIRLNDTLKRLNPEAALCRVMRWLTPIFKTV